MPDKLSIEDSFEVEFAKNLFSLECLVAEDCFFCTEEEFIDPNIYSSRQGRDM